MPDWMMNISVPMSPSEKMISPIRWLTMYFSYPVFPVPPGPDLKTAFTFAMAVQVTPASVKVDDPAFGVHPHGDPQRQTCGIPGRGPPESPAPRGTEPPRSGPTARRRRFP